MVKITLRPEQEEAVDRSIAWLAETKIGEIIKLLWSSPTGTGKTYVANAIKDRAAEQLGLRGFVVSPNDDILSGFAAKAGIIPRSDGTYTKAALEIAGYYTPIRLRNLIAAGFVKPPAFIIADEAHHWDTDTSKLLDLLCMDCPAIGLTATPFRGTPKATLEFRKKWGPPHPIITMAEAVKQGYMQFPSCRIIPLLDDDVIEVKNGEFVVAAMEEQLTDVVERLCFEVSRFYGSCGYDKPTILSLPSVALARMYTRELNAAGLPALCITGESTSAERRSAFDACIACTHALVQIRVVSEGVDLPLRRLIDLSPTLSPVLWLQQFGRITRPGDTPAEYICTNRNLLRHAYLLEGLLPVEVYKAGEAAFGKPSDRQTARAIGFEGLGKFKAEDIPLHNGTSGQLICISAAEGSLVTEYAAIASPLHAEVLYARRVNERKPDGTKYDQWVRIEAIPNLDTGFASVNKGSLSPAQGNWWKNAARFYGLDSTAKINRRQFVALPVLKHTGFRFR